MLDLAAIVGPDPTWHRLAHATNAVSRVTGPHQSVIVKTFTSDRPYRQERRAYHEWSPHLRDQTASLISTDDASRTLVLTYVPGDPAFALTPQAECTAHWHAGRFLHTLHTISTHDPDPVPLDDALSKRHDAWLRRLAPHLAPDLHTRLAALAADIPPLFAAAVRVPTHRDFTPRNWLLHGPTNHVRSLTVVDFEHARPDIFSIDLVKLAAEQWPSRPDLEEALLTGYGRDLTPHERAQLKILVAQHAMATLAWAHSHRDPTFLAAGTTALATALA